MQQRTDSDLTYSKYNRNKFFYGRVFRTVLFIFYLIFQTFISIELLDMGIDSGWNPWCIAFIALVLLGSVLLLGYIIVKLIKSDDTNSNEDQSEIHQITVETEAEPDDASVIPLLLGLLGDSDDDSLGEKDTGHCNGDCDNCPPHYGYRYGRWYYGHGHQHGCQRGGNGGASGECYRN